MAAVVIAPPQGNEPQRFWTNLGPKTVEEILELCDSTKVFLNYGELAQEAKDAVEALLAKRDEEYESKADAEAREQKIRRWRQNKIDAARRFKR
jgi:hypothetical protein